MEAKKVKIDSAVANLVITNLTNSCNLLEGDILTKLSSNFKQLQDLGFASTCISKIQEQIKDVVEVEKQIIDAISSHITTTVDTEDQLYNEYVNRRGGSSSSGDVSSYVNEADGSEVMEETVEVIEHKNNLKQTILKEIIARFDEKNKIKLVRYLNFFKSKETSLLSLLLDNSKSEELFTLLKKALKDYIDLEGFTIDDIKEVQKQVLDALLTGEVEYKEFKDDSILMIKEYLVKVSKDYGINPSDMLLEENNKKLLQKALVDAYNGNDGDVLSKEVQKKYKEYINSVAKENNITVKELLKEKTELLIK